MKLAAEGFQTYQTNKKGAYILIFLSSYAGIFYYNQGEDYAPHITATSPRFENISGISAVLLVLQSKIISRLLDKVLTCIHACPIWNI